MHGSKLVEQIGTRHGRHLHEDPHRPPAPPVAFWALALTLGVLLAASAAPSPLYVVYQGRWHFSSLTLTTIFAVYVGALLLALVVAGSLSDRLGRRPVLIGALLVELVAMLLFAVARDVDALLAARVVQGLATGVATGALSAALIDLQPPRRPQLGAVVSGAAPLLGLAAGALGSGLLVQYGPDPLRLVFWLLAGAFVLALAVVVAMPEPVAVRRPDWLGALRPRVGVPRDLRRPFVAVAPILVATWALGGLYLSLGPSLAVALLHTTSHVTGGLVIVALSATGAIASVALRAHPAERLMLAGASLLTVGVGLTLLGLNHGSTGSSSRAASWPGSGSVPGSPGPSGR